MFDLDQAIQHWRTQLANAGTKNPELLDELESHLRDDIERRQHDQPDPHQAFNAAVSQLGQAHSLQKEFNKVSSSGHLLEHLREMTLTLAGFPTPVLATDMNATCPTPSEPRWASYVKALVFALPALVAWGFSLVFLLPRVNFFCAKTGFEGFAMLDAMVALSYYWFIPLGVVAAMLLLLERRFKKWPHYRKAALGIGAFMLNSLVLTSIILMVIAVVVCASTLGK